MVAPPELRPARRKTSPNHYIALCARKYAETTRRLASAESEGHQQELKALLNYLRDSAILETEATRSGRRWSLPEDLRKWVDRKGEVNRAIAAPEAEALRFFYAAPGGGLLGISSAEMSLVADLYEGWSCTAGLEPLASIQCQGMADGMRLMSGFLGPDHEPHEPPTRSITRFIYDGAFSNLEKSKKG